MVQVTHRTVQLLLLPRHIHTQRGNAHIELTPRTATFMHFREDWLQVFWRKGVGNKAYEVCGKTRKCTGLYSYLLVHISTTISEYKYVYVQMTALCPCVLTLDDIKKSSLSAPGGDGVQKAIDDGKENQKSVAANLLFTIVILNRVEC